MPEYRTRIERELVNHNLVDIPPSGILLYCIITHIHEFCNELHPRQREELYDIIENSLDEILSKFENVLSKTPDPDDIILFDWLDRSVPDYWEEPSCEAAWPLLNQYGIDKEAKPERFIRVAMAMALHVRNEMEDFHWEFLTDEQMKGLNPKIRQGLFVGLVIFIKGEPPHTEHSA
jgi:hypothetical protein